MGGADNDILVGGAGADTIHGGSGNDELSGARENDWLYAGGFDDLATATNVLNGGAGDDFLQGGDGIDTLFGGPDDDDLRGGSNVDVLYGDDGADQLYGEAGNDMVFGDNLPVHYFADTSASVYRLYLATLGRAPDAAGHQDWTTRLATGDLTLVEAADGFVNSTEFNTTYGSSDTEDFINRLYQNVLDRNADAAGRSNWSGELEGGLSRAQVVLGFSDSPEFQNKTATEAAQYGQANTQQTWTADVFRLYQATLDRAPDVDGMFNWSERLGSGTEYLDAVNGFVDSREFKNRFGDELDNTDFVKLMYQNVLKRSADEPGLAGWVGDLEDGAPRTAVVRGFAQSNEFRNSTADGLQEWMRDNFAGDELSGGAGDDVMAGGFGSDIFVFRQADAGRDDVVDLEAWDYVDLSDFGFATLAAAQAAFTQDGADVVFTSGEVEAVFRGAVLSDFDGGLLLL
ncbi:DUF4214 domain-containing protein [Sulfitobacter sp. S190]|nr:DUF4214 domain-containing protein [Sulfitobacter sp. S190]